MSRQIDYQSTMRYPADAVFATVTDADFLRARLAEIGGPGADLIEHELGATGGGYRLRHGLAAADLPPMMRSMLPGELVIERSERWQRESAGRYRGEVEVLIKGTPASAAGGMLLHDDDSGGSTLAIQADVSVRVPLIGSRIEEVVAEQVQVLLAAENAFTVEWLLRSG